ncbi:hypothetical protein MNBD_NITROSPINAE05-759 [hydrothermal vent metagenome]|uniref:Methyltransferase type 11 domain-containing protein n=1 Tax=hydrothermal vent metagenome TaxID=652676 RepID=A0A3B1CC79_9ZZZZ
MQWTAEENRWVEVFQTLKSYQLFAFDNIATASQYWIAYEHFLKSVTVPGARVLDWGCGSGHFSYFLLNNGFKTESFNVNAGDSYHPDGIKIADLLTTRFKDAFNFKISSGDPVKLPYPDESFDAVVSVGVLEHVRQEGGDEIKSLKEIRRILKKGGVFLCFHFPNKYSWVEAVARQIPSKHHHLYRFTKKNILDLNEAAGLNVETVQAYAVLPRNELARLPEGIKNNPTFVKFYNRADRLLPKVLPPVFQNYYFRSRKEG